MSISDNYSPLVALGDGTTTIFSDTWNPISADYIIVVLRDNTTGVDTPQVQGVDYSVTLLPGAGFTITFLITPPPLGVTVVGSRAVPIDQNVPYTTSKGFQGSVNEGSFDKLTAIDQDQQDELDRALKFPVGSPVIDIEVPTPVANTALVWNETADGLTNGPTVEDIENAEQNAIDAAASALAASDSADLAAVSEGNAEAAALAAQAAADSIAYEVEVVTPADSPISAESGTLYVCNTASGPITINLPSIAAVGEPANVAVQKSTADGNAITLVGNGTDTVNNSPTYDIISLGTIYFYADIDTTPDNWEVVSTTSGGGNLTVDTFADGVDYTSGVSTSLTTSSPAGAENNTWITFDGVDQHKTQYSVSGTTVTFTAPIPVGVSEIEVQYGTTVSIGVAGDGTVGITQLSDALVVTEAEGIENNDNDTTIPTSAAVKNLTDGAVSRVLLETIEASNDSSIDFDSGNIDDTYDSYVIVGISIVAATDGAQFYARTSSTGGAPYDNGATHYRRAGYTNRDGTNTVSSINDSNQAQIEIYGTTGVSNAAGESCNFTMTMYNPSVAPLFTMMQIDGVNSTNNGSQEIRMTNQAVMRRDLANVVNAIQFFFSTGNIASGIFKLYGVK